MFVHVFFMFPETAGKTLEEVELIFTDGIPAWKTRVDMKSTLDVEQFGEAHKEKLATIEQEENAPERRVSEAPKV